MDARAARIVFWVWVVLFLSACNSGAIQVARVEPSEQHLRTETLDLRNCDQLEPLDETLDQRSPVDLVISIADEARISATGEVIPIPAELKAQIVAQIERIYHDTYEAAQAKVSEDSLYVPADRIRVYEVRWMERRYSAEVALSIENQPCRAAYTYTLTIPELGDYKEMACTA